MKLGAPFCEITFFGSPVAKSRPRFSRYGTYDTQSEIKKRLIIEAQEQLKDFKVFKGPLLVMAEFFMPIPASIKSKTKRRDMIGLAHIKKPDLDNIFKMYSDVLEGIVYYNDSQIHEIHACKLYSEEPKTQLKFYILEEDD